MDKKHLPIHHEKIGLLIPHGDGGFAGTIIVGTVVPAHVVGAPNESLAQAGGLAEQPRRQNSG